MVLKFVPDLIWILDVFISLVTMFNTPILLIDYGSIHCYMHTIAQWLSLCFVLQLVVVKLTLAQPAFLSLNGCLRGTLSTISTWLSHDLTWIPSLSSQANNGLTGLLPFQIACHGIKLHKSHFSVARRRQPSARVQSPRDEHLDHSWQCIARLKALGRPNKIGEDACMSRRRVH